MRWRRLREQFRSNDAVTNGYRQFHSEELLSKVTVKKIQSPIPCHQADGSIFQSPKVCVSESKLIPTFTIGRPYKAKRSG